MARRSPPDTRGPARRPRRKTSPSPASGRELAPIPPPEEPAGAEGEPSEEPTEGELLDPDALTGEPDPYVDLGAAGEAELVDDEELARLAREAAQEPEGPEGAEKGAARGGARAPAKLLEAVPEEGAGRHALVARDPLTAYIQQIRRVPLLSREEEHRFAAELVRTRDPQIRARLIASNLRLVVKIAHEYRRAYRNLLDLVQEGNIGLVQAVDKYDPYRGVKLSSYAAWWIRAYILKFILNNWRLVKIGTTQAQRKLFFNLKKEKEKLQQAGFEAGPKLLAERLSVTEQEVEEMESRLASADLSLDAPITREDGEGHSHIDRMPSPEGGRPDVQLEGEEFQRLLRAKLEAFAATLEGREQTIFHDRLLASEPLTLKEIGDKYAISRERARQIEKRLIERLRIYLQREMGEAVNIALGIEE